MNSHLYTSRKEKAKESVPFRIRKLHRGDSCPGEPQPGPGRTNAVEIIWISRGAGSLVIDQNRYPVGENTLFFVAPGQDLQFQTTGLTEGYVISFTESFLSEEEAGSGPGDYAGLLCQLLQNPFIRTGGEAASEIGDIAGKMLKESENYFLLRSEMLRRYTKIFLIHIQRQLRPAGPGPAPNGYLILVHKFIALLETNFRDKKMVTDYAGQLSVSPGYLNEAVKKIFGFPASHLIRQRVVLEAKRKALYSDANMKEVAYSLGFEDTAHFSKFFKNTAGLNFTDFRKETGLPVSHQV
jgi:AraC-like DNA-binding protein